LFVIRRHDALRRAGDNDRAVTILKQDVLKDNDPNGISVTDSEADCVARATVDRLGIVRLEQMGMEVGPGTAPTLDEADLTSAEKDALFSIFDRCADFTSKLAALLIAGAQLSQAEATCVAERYEQSGLLRRSLFSSDFDPALNDEIDQAFADATAACT